MACRPGLVAVLGLTPLLLTVGSVTTKPNDKVPRHTVVKVAVARGAWGPHATPPTGSYADARAGSQRYEITVSSNQRLFTGWLYFIYQDGRTSLVFHYRAQATSGPTFIMRTDASPQPFTIGSRPPLPQAGSEPLPAGEALPGNYSHNTIVLSHCASYLYWANAAHTPRPASCTFSRIRG
jgi:hypothetical protein